MLYLIPAWYQDGQWSEKEQYWYRKRAKTEFDDTVKQMQLFHRSRALEYKILLLGFSPNLRHFLHRQGVLRAPYWSCFDAIQEIRRKKLSVFSFNNISWPAGTEFVYTPFVVLAYQNGQKYAKVEFGEDGNPIQIDMYENGIVCRQNIYDDRGFVSSTIVYKEGSAVYQDYLMENGIWKIRVFMENGHVLVNPNYCNYRIVSGAEEKSIPFERQQYESLEQIIGEVLGSYLQTTDASDLFCMAMHRMHTGVLTTALQGRKTIASFFENRYEVKHDGLMQEILRTAGYVVADSEDTIERLRQDYGAYLENIMYISPFDSRVDFGISQQLTVKKILVPVDRLSDAVLSEMIECLGRYMMANEFAEVVLFTRSVDQAINRKCYAMVEKIAGRLEQEEVPVKKTEDWMAEMLQKEAKPLAKRFTVENCVDELSVSKCMREQRILLDFREEPELYLQIVAISMGIPQIAKRSSAFVRNGKNGKVVAAVSQLTEAVSYYLDNLENWNDAMVRSYEIGKEYSTEVLLDKWKEVTESFE